MKFRLLACGLLAVLWATPSFAAETLRGADGLQHEEIRAAQSVSRAVFAAQRAERREIERAGISELGAELDRLRERLADASTAGLEREHSGLRTAGVAPLGGDGGGGSRAHAEAQRANLRVARVAACRDARDRLMARKRSLAADVSSLSSRQQREIATSVIGALDLLEPRIEDALSEADAGQTAEVDALFTELRGVSNRITAAGSRKPDPGLTTRVEHRRAVPRIP